MFASTIIILMDSPLYIMPPSPSSFLPPAFTQNIQNKHGALDQETHR